jgi:hypothetical protein
MPDALCPRAPHLSEKGYISVFAIGLLYHSLDNHLGLLYQLRETLIEGLIGLWATTNTR